MSDVEEEIDYEEYNEFEDDDDIVVFGDQKQTKVVLTPEVDHATTIADGGARSEAQSLSK